MKCNKTSRLQTDVNNLAIEALKAKVQQADLQNPQAGKAVGGDRFVEIDR